MGVMVVETGANFSDVDEDHYPILAERKLRLERAFRNELEGQIELSKTLARLSPLASYTLASVEIAGSGLAGRYRFMDQLVEYQHELVAFADQAWQRSRDPGRAYTIEDHPRFVYAPLSLSDRMRFVWTDVVLLVLWNGVLSLGSFVAFLRYDVQ